MISPSKCLPELDGGGGGAMVRPRESSVEDRGNEDGDAGRISGLGASSITAGPKRLLLPKGTSLVPVVVFTERHDMLRRRIAGGGRCCFRLLVRNQTGTRPQMFR